MKVLDWLVAGLLVFDSVARLLRQFAGYGDLTDLIPGPLLSVCAVYVLLRFATPLAVGRGQPVGEIPRPAERPMAEARCVGVIGPVPFRVPFLGISVYPDRFVMRVLWREHTIMGSDIDSVGEDALLRLRISHAAPHTRSPIRLYLKRDNPARIAIKRIDMTREAEHFDRIHWDE